MKQSRKRVMGTHTHRPFSALFKRIGKCPSFAQITSDVSDVTVLKQLLKWTYCNVWSRGVRLGSCCVSIQRPTHRTDMIKLSKQSWKRVMGTYADNILKTLVHLCTTIAKNRWLLSHSIEWLQGIQQGVSSDVTTACQSSQWKATLCSFHTRWNVLQWYGDGTNFQ